MAHYECKYCDRPQGYMGIPIKSGNELVCACGAEWEDAKVLVDDEENMDDLLSCGCFESIGCTCNEEDFDDLPCGCSKYFGCECDSVYKDIGLDPPFGIITNTGDDYDDE